jgi:cytochrome c oxidase subunit IV
MDHSSNTHSPEVTFHHAPAGDEHVKKIIRTTVILSVITLIELALGFGIYFIHQSPDYSHALVLFIKGVIVILSLLKAFYIVGVFMHLGDEVRNLIMTIVVPLLLFVWFIAAFLWEGNSWLNLRNTDAGSRPYPEKQIVAPKDAKKPGVE